MKKTVALLIVASSLISNVVFAGDDPCKDKILSICETNAQGNPVICQMLKQDAMETPESILAFMKVIIPLSPEEQEKMICARLLGKKRIKLGLLAGDNKNEWIVDHEKNIYEHNVIQTRDGHRCIDSIKFLFWKNIDMVATQWIIVNKMHPNNDELAIILEADITRATFERQNECGGFLSVEVLLENVRVKDKDSVKKIKTQMQSTLNIGLEQKKP